MGSWVVEDIGGAMEGAVMLPYIKHRPPAGKPFASQRLQEGLRN